MSTELEEPQLSFREAHGMVLDGLFSIDSWGFGRRCLDQFDKWWPLRSVDSPNVNRVIASWCRCWLAGCHYVGYAIDPQYNHLVRSLQIERKTEDFSRELPRNIAVVTLYLFMFVVGAVGQYNIYK